MENQVLLAPQGEQGPQGEAGPQGSQGVAGADGLDGGIGPQGVQGEQGPAGPQGEEGPPGPVGPAGPQGIPGVQGPAGGQGPAGPQGIRGEKGDTGPAGKDAENGQAVFTAKGMCPGVNVISHVIELPNSPGVTIGLRGTTSANFDVAISNKSGASVALRNEIIYSDSTTIKKVSNVTTCANNATVRIFQYTWVSTQNRSFNFTIYDATNNQYYEGFYYTAALGSETSATQVPALLVVKAL